MRLSRPGLSGLVILWAACSSSSPGSSDATTSSDGSAPLTCATTVAEYCAAGGCDLTLAEAEDDMRLCPASLAVCGDSTVITQTGIDSSTSLYYLSDQLVAIAHTVAPRPPSCLAGPPTFFPPSCTSGSLPLPACTQ